MLSRASLVGLSIIAVVTFVAPTISEAKKGGGQKARRACEEGESALEEAVVTIFGTQLRLGTVLDQLARNHGLNIVYGKDINMKREVDVPTLKQVPLRDALRVILSPIGYSFAFEGCSLVIFSRYTRIFRIDVPMVTQNWFASMSNESQSPLQAGGGGAGGAGGGGAGGAGGGAISPGGGGAGLGAQISLQSRSSSKGIWEELDANMKTLVSRAGTYSINQVAGLITVTDTPESLDAVDRYITLLNEEMGLQAVIEVRVAEVSSRNNVNAGVDWNAIFDRLSGSIISTSSNVAAQFLDEVDSSVTATFAGVNGQAILQAIEEDADVDVVVQPNLLVGNNLPALLQEGRIVTYVSEVAATAVEGAAAVTIQTDILSEGLTLSLLPRLDRDGRVTITVGVILQDIVEIQTRSFDNGAAVLDLPIVDRRTYSGTVSGRFGDTIVIGGLIDKRREVRKNGVPFLAKVPVLGAFFGAQGRLKESTELVLLLTPRSIAAAKPRADRMKKFLDPMED